jgi:hypothetical protein
VTLVFVVISRRRAAASLSAPRNWQGGTPVNSRKVRLKWNGLITATSAISESENGSSRRSCIAPITRETARW